eukprot:TRINITY_DN1106_c0_g3_i1.p1 TRINITY_DN1106_c0_g3~~TRINITY_DN1106_c0_g3_i1.p1  ORF type:complete len:1085 (+),score=157.00 TRINITY_DN1106_c0_g3_i1:358-3612(+)
MAAVRRLRGGSRAGDQENSGSGRQQGIPPLSPQYETRLQPRSEASESDDEEADRYGGPRSRAEPNGSANPNMSGQGRPIPRPHEGSMASSSKRQGVDEWVAHEHVRDSHTGMGMAAPGSAGKGKSPAQLGPGLKNNARVQGIFAKLNNDVGRSPHGSSHSLNVPNAAPAHSQASPRHVRSSSTGDVMGRLSPSIAAAGLGGGGGIGSTKSPSAAVQAPRRPVPLPLIPPPYQSRTPPGSTGKYTVDTSKSPSVASFAKVKVAGSRGAPPGIFSTKSVPDWVPKEVIHPDSPQSSQQQQHLIVKASKSSQSSSSRNRSADPSSGSLASSGPKSPVDAPFRRLVPGNSLPTPELPKLAPRFLAAPSRVPFSDSAMNRDVVVEGFESPPSPPKAARPVTPVLKPSGGSREGRFEEQSGKRHANEYEDDDRWDERGKEAPGPNAEASSKEAERVQTDMSYIEPVNTERHNDTLMWLTRNLTMRGERGVGVGDDEEDGASDEEASSGEQSNNYSEEAEVLDEDVEGEEDLVMSRSKSRPAEQRGDEGLNTNGGGSRVERNDLSSEGRRGRSDEGTTVSRRSLDQQPLKSRPSASSRGYPSEGSASRDGHQSADRAAQPSPRFSSINNRGGRDEFEAALPSPGHRGQASQEGSSRAVRPSRGSGDGKHSQSQRSDRGEVDDPRRPEPSNSWRVFPTVPQEEDNELPVAAPTRRGHSRGSSVDSFQVMESAQHPEHLRQRRDLGALPPRQGKAPAPVSVPLAPLGQAKAAGGRKKLAVPSSSGAQAPAAPLPVAKKGNAFGLRNALGFAKKDKSILQRALADVNVDYFVHKDELGRGRFGVIRVCEHRETGERLACKSISKARLKCSQDVEDVRREVAVMEMLRGHPDVVHLTATYEDNEYVHLLMELCAGGELFDRIKLRKHYSERAAAKVCKTVAEVLCYIHSLGVMHRDLKPENILLLSKDDDTSVKVIDYGVAAFFKPGKPCRDVAGSPFYLAPEVLAERYGPAADVWSAGVVLYILLAGIPPFWANTNEGIFAAIKEARVNLTRKPWPEVSERAKDLVRQMLTKDAKQRITPEGILAHPFITSNVR